MRKNLGPKSLLIPEMVLIVSAYDEKGKANAMTAAWGGISDTNEIMICLSSNHKTTKNILKKKAYTVSVGTKDYVKECDYLGLVSGNRVANKLEKCGFHVVKGENVDAPIIEELPFALECKLKKYDKHTGHLFGEIVNVSVDSKYLRKDKINIAKLNPIVFDESNSAYLTLGKKVGNAYKDGKKIIDKKNR